MGGLWSMSTETVLGSAAWNGYDSGMGRGGDGGIQGRGSHRNDSRHSSFFLG